ncbi:hypothetical protein ASE12_15490 [Aeromicrobium sp. Root236]|uniref:hypothetical protein n=1 Tax=Aeromicrobium sp. Root236 TaxID=1736498 RepID=UPI0006FE94C8|nr:hypothetical protein [Aeromicrobium sp. Root236]KRC66034.1 hypothetical protein ASE12_15490 [Aeromicrobium sp. Root236]
MDGMRLRLVLISVVVPLLVIAAAIVGGRWAGTAVSADPGSALPSALDTLPADTQVAGFTDWSRVRRVLGVGSTTVADRAALTDDASLRDLSTRSVLGPYTEQLHDSYGWSPADLDWEVYGQADDGSVMVARLDDAVSFGSVRSHLTKLGYTQDGGVWTIGKDSPIARSEFAGTLAAITLVPGRRLIVAADRATYAHTVLRTIDRDAPSLLSVRSAADVASALVGADSALLQTGGFACRSTSLADAGADVQAQARAAIDRAGALRKPRYAGRALDAGSKRSETMRFALAFGSPGAAADQVAVRRALTTGPFIGRSGRVEESLVLRSAAVRGSTAVLRFRHDPDSTAYMTGDGPLLFAGCPE